MDAIDKRLASLGERDRHFYLALFARIRNNELTNLDVRKLKGHPNHYRIRHGLWRIIFVRYEQHNAIIGFGRRNEKTYRDL